MRQSGKTTRLVDRNIQQFFEKGYCFIYEGRATDTQEEETNYALELFTSRLRREHFQTSYNYEYGTFDGIKCYRVNKI
jgi:hypothetical protein